MPFWIEDTAFAINESPMTERKVTSAFGPGCVKTHIQGVFRGRFTIPDPAKRGSGRCERPSLRAPVSDQRFYTAWAVSSLSPNGRYRPRVAGEPLASEVRYAAKAVGQLRGQPAALGQKQSIASSLQSSRSDFEIATQRFKYVINWQLFKLDCVAWFAISINRVFLCRELPKATTGAG
jgi:hypothetical protein